MTRGVLAIDEFLVSGGVYPRRSLVRQMTVTKGKQKPRRRQRGLILL